MPYINEIIIYSELLKNAHTFFLLQVICVGPHLINDLNSLQISMYFNNVRLLKAVAL